MSALSDFEGEVHNEERDKNRRMQYKHMAAVESGMVVILLILAIAFVVLFIPTQTTVNVNLLFTGNTWNATLNYSKITTYQHSIAKATNLTRGNTELTIEILNATTNSTLFSRNYSIIPNTYLINTNYIASTGDIVVVKIPDYSYSKVLKIGQ